jgi:signal peptidase I
MAETALVKRNPSTAATLSLFCTGLGHIYCGRFATGLALSFSWLLPVPFAVAAAFSQNPRTILPGLLLPCVLLLLVYLWAIVDSYRLARTIGEHYQRKDYNRAIVYALFIGAGVIYPATVALHVRAMLFEAMYCAGEGMSPTIAKGDRFMVNKLVERQLPARGDVVVFVAPDKRDLQYVKRVIGLPGDTVAVAGNDVFVNGQKLDHQPSPAPFGDAAGGGAIVYETDGEAAYAIQPAADGAAASFPEAKVPAGHCFVLCDNRSESTDSRQFGFVPLGDILGKAQYLYWPASGWTRFGAIGGRVSKGT